MSALRTATTSTTGSMSLSHVEKGRPRTIQRMFVKTEPLTRVAKKPMIRGTRRNFPRWRGTKAFTRRQAVKDPAISLAMLPKGNADLEEGTMVSPATNPVPRARKRPG